MSQITPTERTRVRRLPKRAVYDREVLYRILDEALVCHIGFVADGKPVVIPTGYARHGDNLYIHGSTASRMLRELGTGVDVSVAVTLLDGLVLARSAFHHSMNYRSVVVFGKATVLSEPAEKREALRLFTEHIAPGRWQDVRPPNENELKATAVLRLPLAEASAKMRTGGPLDDDDDYALPVWAGVLPMRLTPASPISDERLGQGIAIPKYVNDYDRTKI